MASRTLAIILAGSSKGSERALRDTDRALGGFEKTIRRVGKVVAVAGVAMVAAFGKAATAAAALESSNVKLRTQLGLSAEAADAVRREVIDLSRTTGVAAVELSEASFAIQSAGLRGAAASEVLASSARLAAVGLGQTRDIALATGAVLTAYGRANISAATASDVLLATVKEGNLEASELAGSLGQALPVASNLGVTFQELGASIAVYTRLGLTASQATTGVRAAMTALFNPSIRARTSLEKVGVAASELSDMVDEHGLAGTLQILRDQLDDDVAFAKLLSSSEALGFALAVTNENLGEFQRTLDSIEGSAGAVDEAFGIVAETTEFKFNQAMANLNALVIDIGANILPLANKFLEFVGRVADGLVDFAEGLGLVESGIDRLETKLGLTDGELGSLVDRLAGSESFMTRFGDAINDVTSALSGGLIPNTRTEREILEDKIELLAQTAEGHKAIEAALAGNDNMLRLFLATLSEEEIQARATADAEAAAAAGVDDVAAAAVAAVPVVEGLTASNTKLALSYGAIALGALEARRQQAALAGLYSGPGTSGAVTAGFSSQMSALGDFLSGRVSAAGGPTVTRSGGTSSRKTPEQVEAMADARAVGQAERFATALELEGQKRDDFISSWLMAEQADRDLKHDDELAYYRREETDAERVFREWQEQRAHNERAEEDRKKMLEEMTRVAEATADLRKRARESALAAKERTFAGIINQLRGTNVSAETAVRVAKHHAEEAYETEHAQVIREGQGKIQRLELVVRGEGAFADVINERVNIGIQNGDIVMSGSG